MNSYFYVKWKDQNKKNHIVGFLVEKDNRYHFMYNHNEKMLQNAYKNGFTFIPTFMDKKLYTSSELFPFFKRRIPEKERIDIWTKLIKEYDENELLSITGAKSVTDGISVEKVNFKIEELL